MDLQTAHGRRGHAGDAPGLAEIAGPYAVQLFLHLAGKAAVWSENGYGFAAEEPQDVLGRIYAVERIEPYDPKRLKRELKGRGAEVLKRDFPLAAEELMRRLGLHPGAELRLAFTRIGNDFWVIRLK